MLVIEFVVTLLGTNRFLAVFWMIYIYIKLFAINYRKLVKV